MFKLIILVVGLGIGFGGGVYWGVNHPNEAASMAAVERHEAQKLQDKVSQVVNPQPAHSDNK